MIRYEGTESGKPVNYGTTGSGSGTLVKKKTMVTMNSRYGERKDTGIQFMITEKQGYRRIQCDEKLKVVLT